MATETTNTCFRIRDSDGYYYKSGLKRATSKGTEKTWTSRHHATRAIGYHDNPPDDLEVVKFEVKEIDSFPYPPKS